MTTDPRRPPPSRPARASIALEALLGIGAAGGGLVLIVAPHGEIMPLPLSALVGSPFETYLGGGLILFTVLGIWPLVAAGLAWLRHPLAPFAEFVVGSQSPSLPSAGWPRSDCRHSIAGASRRF